MKTAVNHALNAVLKVNNSWGLQLKTQKIWFDYQVLEGVDLVKAQRDQIYINAGLELDKSYFVEALGYEERHIKGFGEVKSDRLKVKGGEMLNLAQKPITYHLSPITLDDEEITAEDKQSLNDIQKSLNELLKELGIWKE